MTPNPLKTINSLTAHPLDVETEKNENVIQVIDTELEKITKERTVPIQALDQKLNEDLKETTKERNRSFPEILSAGAALFFFGFIGFAITRNYWNPLDLSIKGFIAISVGLVALSCVCVCVVACCRKKQLKIVHDIEMQDILEQDLGKQKDLSRAYVPKVTVTQTALSNTTDKDSVSERLLQDETSEETGRFIFDRYHKKTTTREGKEIAKPEQQFEEEQQSLLQFD